MCICVRKKKNEKVSKHIVDKSKNYLENGPNLFLFGRGDLSVVSTLAGEKVERRFGFICK